LGATLATRYPPSNRYVTLSRAVSLSLSMQKRKTKTASHNMTAQNLREVQRVEAASVPPLVFTCDLPQDAVAQGLYYLLLVGEVSIPVVRVTQEEQLYNDATALADKA